MSESNQGRYIILGSVGIILSIFIAIFLANQKEKPRSKPFSAIKPVVRVAVVERGEQKFEITGFGRLQSAYPIALAAEATGTVMAGTVPFRDGQTFRKGDLLLKIDERQTKFDLMTAKSQFLNALANLLSELKVEFPDIYPQWQSYFDAFTFEASLKELPQTGNGRLKLFLARFNIYQLYFSAKKLEVNFEKHFIRAPYNGVIVAAAVRPGGNVRNGTMLGNIISTDALEVEVPMRVEELRWISKGSEVSLEASGESCNGCTGKVVRIGQAVDAQTETVPVFIKVTGDPANLPPEGQFINVTFAAQSIPNAVRVPEKSVMNNRFVYLIRNSALSRLPVDIMHHGENEIIINGAIANGDTLVVQALQGVSDGQQVIPSLAGAQQ